MGGYDRLRKQTLPQVKAMFREMGEEQLFQAKIHGCIKDEKEEGYQDFSQGFSAMKAMFGGGF